MKKYPTDLTDSQWNHIKEMFPPPKRPGDRAPLSFGKWSTPFCIYYLQVANGGLSRMIIRLGAPVTVILERGRMPDCGIEFTKLCALICVRKKDGTSIRLPGCWIRNRSRRQPCQVREALMAEKKIMGRKRHILVDTMGLMMALVVTKACVQDRDGLKKLLRSFGIHRKKLRKVWVDGGYRGQILEWVRSRFRYFLEVVLRSDDSKGFVVLPRRWVVERTFAWLNNHRRLSQKTMNASPRRAKR